MATIVLKDGEYFSKQHGRFIVYENGERKYRSRAVMEKYIGRDLMPGEIVHHLNGDKTDDRIDNLELMTHQRHNNIHKNNITYSRSDLITALEKARSLLGRISGLWSYTRLKMRPHGQVFYRVFGSWPKALAAAGMSREVA